MDRLLEFYQRLIRETSLEFRRYLYCQIDWNNRLIGLVGPRGVGKTTLILQHIKAHCDLNTTLYVNAEDFYFANNRISDLAEQFVKLGGKSLFIDEIHKYPEWSRELKLIYDYHPELSVVFTGSSILDIKKGASDLSRRAMMYQLQGLSFREYLELFHQIQAPVFSLGQILNHEAKIDGLAHPLPLFSDYLRGGYYPFSTEKYIEQRIRQVITQTLESDIPFFAGMNIATARKLKQLLAIIAESVPFKPNFSKIAQLLGASRNNIADYCHYIEEAGMIIQLKNSTKGIRELGKVEKVYLDNTNLIYALSPDQPNIGNIRETFFINQLRINHQVAAAKTGDFEIDGTVFEIGGKNKSKKQIENQPNAWLVKDDIEIGYLNTIPLWHFGLIY